MAVITKPLGGSDQPTVASVQSGTTEPTSQRELRGISYKWTVLMVVVIGMFMSILDQTIVNVALPHIIAVFNADVHSIQLVVTGYALALAIVIPATGYLQDTFGAKRMWLISLTAFSVGSMLCGLAWNTESLVVFRVIQGLGGGMLQPMAMAMIYRVVPPAERGFTMGMLGIPLLVAPAIGPTLGGWLVESVDWRFIFMINVPVGILGVFMAALLLREFPTKAGLKFDFLGFFTAAIAFSCALVGLSNGPSDGWNSLHIEALLLSGVVFLIAWIVVELRVSEPLLDLRLFKDFIFSMGQVVQFVVTVALFGATFLLPLFLQQIRGLGAMETGLLLLPQGVAAAVAMPIGGKLFDKIGARPLVVGGLLMLAAATFMLTRIDVTTPDEVIVLALILRGVSMGFTFMPLTTAVMNQVPMEKINRASALTGAVRQLFVSFGIAMVTTTLTNRETLHVALLSEKLTAVSPACPTGHGRRERDGRSARLDAAASEATAPNAAQRSGTGPSSSAGLRRFLLDPDGVVPHLGLSSVAAEEPSALGCQR